MTTLLFFDHPDYGHMRAFHIVVQQAPTLTARCA